MRNLSKKITILLLWTIKIYAFSQIDIFNNFIIKNIRIEGLVKIDRATVVAYLPLKASDNLTSALADDTIKKLYASNFFSDVYLLRQNDTLIIKLQERPIISQLTLEGDHEFDHDKMIKSLKDNALAAGQVFNQSILDQALIALKFEYYNRGYYGVSVKSKLTNLSRNRINLTITVVEGVATKIASIHIIGNNVFSEKKILGLFMLDNGNWLSWWTKNNQYAREKLAGDLENLKAFYLNQGYIQFKIRSVEVQLTPDKKQVYISINITEGAQYKIKTIGLTGDFKDLNKNKIESLITVTPGEIFDQAKLNNDIENIKTYAGNYGYAYAIINPIPTIVESEHLVSYVLHLDPLDKIYVRQINISGNDKTRDVVIRRELRQSEASLYNSSLIKRSKDRLALLGYFKSTDVNTSPVIGINNQMDVNVKVEENNTGSATFGVGYAQGQGVLFNTTLSQANLFGSGKAASLSGSTSKLSSSAALSFTDPYFRPNGMSLGYDTYINSYTPNLVNISPFSTMTIGARTRLSVPVSEFDRINFSLGLENNQINLAANNVPLRFIQFTKQYGNSVYAVPFSFGWSRNTTDSSLWPTMGATFNETMDATAPMIGAQYYRFISKNNWFIALNNTFTWKINLQAGFINSYGNSDLVPFYQNFFEGGIGSLPGYYIGSLGPKDVDGSSLGGTKMAMLGNEILFPMPGVKDSHSVRLSAFYYSGTLYGGNSFGITPDEAFRASYGLGLTWISPLGPIKVSYALPMFNKTNDNLEPFQFMMGTTF